jgi:hypothetical protein
MATTPEQRRQEWIDAKVAGGTDPGDAAIAARLLEKRGKFADPVDAAPAAPPPEPDRPWIFDTPATDAPSPSEAAFDDTRIPAQRAAYEYASDDPGSFSAALLDYEAAADAQMRRDETETDTEDGPEAARREAEVDEATDRFRQFPGERAGLMAESAPGLLLFGYPTRLDQPETREEKRRNVSREMTKLIEDAPTFMEGVVAPFEAMANVVGVDTIADNPMELWERSTTRRVLKGDDTSMSAAEAEEQGFDKDFVKDEELPMWRRAAGLLAETMGGGLVETAARAMGGDEYDLPEVSSLQDAAEAIEAYGSDPDVRAVTSPEGLKGTAVRAAAMVPFGTVGVDVNEALGRYVRENYGDAVANEMGLMDPRDAKRMREMFEDSRTSPAFDSVAEQEDDAAVLVGIGSLRPVDLPRALSASVPPIAQVRRALEQNPDLAQRPGLDAFARYAREGREDAQLRAALERVPFTVLQEIDPTTGPTVAQVRAAHSARQHARADTGGAQGDAAERLLVSQLFTKEGDRYVPSTIANALRLAGTAEEMVVEADVRAPIAPIGAALATALGAPEETVRMIAEARIPTKAGLDSMLATGAYDELLARFGLGAYQARYAPADQVPYWARVLTNVTLPEEQGAGYRDIGRRAGIGVGSAADSWLGSLDIGIDFLVPFETVVGGVPIEAVKAAARAKGAADLAPSGSRLRAAFAGVLPSASLASEAGEVARVRRGTEAFATLERRLDADVQAGRITREEARARKSYAQTVDDVAEYERLDAGITQRRAAGQITGEQAQRFYGDILPKPKQDAVAAVSQTIGLAVRDAVRRGEDPISILPRPIRSQIEDVLRAAGSDPAEVAQAVRDWSEQARPMYMDLVGRMLAQGGTPQQIALRQTPEYQRVRAEVYAYVVGGELTQAQADAQMALLEVAAHVDAGLNFKRPEDFFGALNYRRGGTAGTGALFEGGERSTLTAHTGGRTASGADRLAANAAARVPTVLVTDEPVGIKLALARQARGPFRAVDHTASAAAFTGSARMPGEVDLAKGGVLFIADADRMHPSAVRALNDAVARMPKADRPWVVVTSRTGEVELKGAEVFPTGYRSIFDGLLYSREGETVHGSIERIDRPTTDPATIRQSIHDKWKDEIAKREGRLAEARRDREASGARSPSTHDLIVASAEGDLRHIKRLRDQEVKAALKALEEGGTSRLNAPNRSGSIEPTGGALNLQTATDYLIRLYQTGDMQTLLHEHGHLLRFVFGPDWMDGLMRHFDNNGTTLTVKGEEQAAEALRWWLRTRTHPNGRVRAYLDDIGVMLQNAWLRLRRDPDLLPPELAAQWDDTLRPDQPVRAAAVSVIQQGLTDPMRHVRVGNTPEEQILQDRVGRMGRAAEAARVSTAADMVREALGLRTSQTQANALDLYSNAVAYVAAEQLRKGWGLDDGVRLTTRTIVPKARANGVLDTVRARVRIAIGVDPSSLRIDPSNGEFILTPAQRAGYDGLVQEVVDSPIGGRLPRDMVMGTAPVTPAHYNLVVEALTDHLAGPGARRSRAAEDVPQTTGYAIVRALRDTPANPLPMGRIREAFVVPRVGEGYIDPGVREVLEAAHRKLGEVHRWVYEAGQRARAGDIRGTLQGIRAQLVPPTPPPAVRPLFGLTTRFTDPNGVPAADWFAALPDIGTAMTAGITRLSDLEVASFYALRQLHANGFDPLDPAQAALFADASERLADGLKRRSALVTDDATKILLAAAGSDDATILKGLTREQLAGAYNAFYSGDWERLFAFTANLGHATGMADRSASKFRPGLAVLEMIARLRGHEVMRELSESLARIGVDGGADAATAARALGDAPHGGRSAFLDRVQHYVELETRWNATQVDNPDPGAIPVRPPPPEGGHDLEAYTVAHRLLAQWGFKYGKGNDWVRRTLPDGSELLLPRMISDEIDAALDRVAKVGTAYGQAPARSGSGLGRALSGEDIDLPIDVKPTASAQQVIPEAVGEVLRKVINLIPATLAWSKVGVTTGIGLPNPAYYIGNAFGGMLQMYAGLGLRGTVRALTSEPRITTAVVARLFGEGKYRPSAPALVTRSGLVYTPDALADLAGREGLSGSFVAAETARGLARDIKRLHPSFWQRMMKGPAAWQNLLMETAQASDNFYRVSAFVDALKRGESPASAAEMARKVGFDYSALTDFEKRYMRNSVMFYSFMRRNLDLFYDTLLTNPHRVLGQLRMLRGANEHFLGEEAEIITPSYLEGRLILGARSAGFQGNIAHDKDLVIQVAPQLGVIDAINLNADIIDTLTAALGMRDGGASDPLIELFARTTPHLQLPIALAFDIDPFSKRSLDSGNRVPANIVEIDRMMTGGVFVDDVLNVHRAPGRDPMNDEAEYQDEWKPGNPRWWYLFTKLGAGRMLDTLAAMDRAGLRPVELLVEGARAVDRSGGKEPGEGDAMQPRAGITEGEELAGVFGIKPVRLDTPEVAKDRLYYRRRQEIRQATKDAEKGAPK